ncbi:MAG: HAD family hydrolase [Planctomycetota bacterium]|jgi:HAD superfamily hydrolase (TIGR01509 family)
MDRLYGLIFDVDGVIADTEGPTAVATIRVFEDLFGAEGVKRDDFEAGLGKGAEAYILAAAKIHGVEMTAEQLGQADRMREDNFIQLVLQSPLPAFEGVLVLMEEALARANFRLAIATSSSRKMSEPVLKGAKVPYERMAYVTGSDVTHKKPHPEIFLKAAASIGIDPADCVIIEDTPGGVEAAKAAGAKCIAVTNTATPEILKDADLICPSLTEIDLQTIIDLVETGQA